jgi:hypothetical protein
LYQYRGDGIVQISDVATGPHFNDVQFSIEDKDKPFVEVTTNWASSNSNVMVIDWNCSKTSSHLSVYDLEAVKKPKSDPGSHRLYTLQIRFYISSFLMDETRIACTGLIGKFYVTALNFHCYSIAKRKSSALKENPEDIENFRIRIILNFLKSNPR